MQRAKNPILNKLDQTEAFDRSYSATYLGITIKTGILILVTIISGAFAWFLLGNQEVDAVASILAVSGITALISVMLASFIPRVAMPFSILYTLAQGFSLGALTFLVELLTAGQGPLGASIAFSAVLITIIIFGVMLALYSSRTLRATNRLRKVMYTAVISILIFSILGLFIPQIQNLFIINPTLGIVLSIGLILYGAFMLILNFDQAEQVVNNGLPKNYEWTVALGLMITLIWIYVEVLRLLMLILVNRE